MGPGQDHRRRPRAAARAGLQRLSVHRVVEVAPDRLVGWVERYSATHPGTVVSAAGGGLHLAAGGAASATLTPLVPFSPAADDLAADRLVPALAEHAATPLPTALVLIRRGGYAVGLALGADLRRSKVGSRYVQSRTAAGGWSQQRFARRRTGQAQELVRAAAAAWIGLGVAAADRPTVLVTGGDRALCEQVLAEPAMRDLLALGVARHLDVPDPRLVVLQHAADRVQRLLVTIDEP